MRHGQGVAGQGHDVVLGGAAGGARPGWPRTASSSTAPASGGGGEGAGVPARPAGLGLAARSGEAGGRPATGGALLRALLHWVIPGQRRSVAWMLRSDGQCEVVEGVAEPVVS